MIITIPPPSNDPADMIANARRTNKDNMFFSTTCLFFLWL